MSQSLFKNPKISSAPVLSGVGNGTLTINRLSHFTINQTYTVTCTAIDPVTVFRVVGDVDGNVGTAQIGIEFLDRDDKVFLTIQQGPTLFAIGDFFTFSVINGTDLTQENIDLYDELPAKNFAPGVFETNAGDANLRFHDLAVLAKVTIQDIEFVSVLVGQLGNRISVEYLAGSVLTAASRVIQDLTYTADTAGAAGNLINIEYIDFIAAVQAKRDIQGIRYNAQVGGTGGNLINITYTGGGTAGSEGVTVVTNDITVDIEPGVSTVQNIRDAVNGFPAATALVGNIALVADSTPQNTQVQTFLQNGANAIGDAGNEVVSVNGNDILVRLESGVSDADQVKAAVDAFGAAAALIDIVVSGTGATAQVIVGPTFLQNGADNVGDPGSEIVAVINERITVQFKTGASTATQILAAINGSGAALALVTPSITGTAGNFQTSPTSELFLKSGNNANTYKFNKEELTVPAAFFGGNGSLLVDDMTVHGTLNVLEAMTYMNVLALKDNQTGPNLSGPEILNAQKNINEGIDNQKIFIKTADNSTIRWNQAGSDELVFTANLEIQIPTNGLENRIATAESPITLLDGEHLFVILDRENTVNLTPQISTSLAKGNKDLIRIATRLGDDLIWYDNTLQLAGQTIRLGSVSEDPEWDAIIGGNLSTHVDINDVMADPNILNIKNILIVSHPAVDLTQLVDRDDVRIQFKDGADFAKGTATLGLQITSNRVRVRNGRFKDFIAGGDVAIRLEATSKNVMIRDNYFVNNIATHSADEIDDLGSGNDYIGNLSEV